MKKIIFMAVAFLVMSFGGMSYMSYLSTGAFNLPFTSFFQNLSTDSVVEGIKEGASSVGSKAKLSDKPETSQQVFKWKDSQGQWHYGSKPPEGINAKSVKINKDQNIIDAVVAPKPKKETETTASAQPIVKPNPYSPAQVKKTIDDAKNVQNLINERFEKQKKILQQ